MKPTILISVLAPFIFIEAQAAPESQPNEVALFLADEPQPPRNAGDWISPVAFTEIPGIPADPNAPLSGHSHPVFAGQAESSDCPHCLAAARPDGHAPIGVMGDHTHSAGGFMLSYRSMFMHMEQNYDGSDSVADSSFAGPPPAPFRVAPTAMDMEMHMFGVMYAPTDRLTLMGMLHLVNLSMDHENLMNGVKFRTESSGLGDSALTALFRFWDNSAQRAHVGLGVLLPTAETDKEDVIPGPGNTRLPYPMQLGAGSWGLSPSLTYLGQRGDWSWGAQGSARIYLTENDEGYRLGNRWEATLWGARRLNDWLSVSVRLAGSAWGNITGSDNDLLPLPVPTANPKLRGGTRLDGALGLNIRIPKTGARVALEFGFPLWQDLDGPQLGVEWWTVLGAQYSF